MVKMKGYIKRYSGVCSVSIRERWWGERMIGGRESGGGGGKG